MKKSLSIFLFLILSFLGLMILPWYTIAVFGAIFSFIGKYSSQGALFVFFIAGFLLWASYAYYLDLDAGSRLASRIGILFGNQKVITLLIITGFLGGITSALGALSGSLLNSYFNSK
ncbi:MAG: hypothetical protein ABI761_02375 [Saprospiraceae bacterium]